VVQIRGGSRIFEWGRGHRSSAEGGWGKFFLTFWLKIMYFGVYSDKNRQFIRPIAGLEN